MSKKDNNVKKMNIMSREHIDSFDKRYIAGIDPINEGEYKIYDSNNNLHVESLVKEDSVDEWMNRNESGINIVKLSSNKELTKLMEMLNEQE